MLSTEPEVHYVVSAITYSSGWRIHSEEVDATVFREEVRDMTFFLQLTVNDNLCPNEEDQQEFVHELADHLAETFNHDRQLMTLDWVEDSGRVIRGWVLNLPVSPKGVKYVEDKPTGIP